MSFRPGGGPIRRHRGFGLLAILLLASIGTPALADFKSILVDDGVSDWSGVAPIYTDPSGDNGLSPIDLRKIWIVNDDQFVYMRFEVGGGPVGIQSLAYPFRIYVDSDSSVATGQPIGGIGSDMMITFTTGGGIFEQTSHDIVAGNIGFALANAYVGPTVASTEYELRLSRFTVLPSQGAQAFSSGGFRLLFVALGAGQQVLESAPEGLGGIGYHFADGHAFPPNNSFVRFDPKQIRITSWNIELDRMFGRDSVHYTRILRSIQPDVLALQEVYSTPASAVASRLDRDLPLAGGAHWSVYKNAAGQATASRYPLVPDGRAPVEDLATRVDLPAGYPADLYLINAHFKCCGSLGSDEDRQRQGEADEIAAWIRQLTRPGSNRLPLDTPIAVLGDLNLVGGSQPLKTIQSGAIVDVARLGAGGPADWDGTPLAVDAPAHTHTDELTAYTWRGVGTSFSPSKLDFMIWTDDVATIGNHFIVNTLTMPPTKLLIHGLSYDDTPQASDHLPSVFDFSPGRPPGSFPPGTAAVQLAISPNPFAASASFAITLTQPGQVEVQVFDITGRRVCWLENGFRPAGRHVVTWNGADAAGRAVEGGLYFVRAKANGAETVARIARVR